MCRSDRYLDSRYMMVCLDIKGEFCRFSLASGVCSFSVYKSGYLYIEVELLPLLSPPAVA